jgi:hypothetical protein
MMRRWFISYNSKDITLASGVEIALRRQDPEAKIYFAPKSLRAGAYWLPDIAREIANSTIFVLLVGNEGLGPWQFDEYCEARERRVTTVLMLLEGQHAPGLPLLSQLNWVVTADPTSQSAIARLMVAAADSDIRPYELWRYSAPYRGLAAMVESDCEFFFGRSKETIEIIKILHSDPKKQPIRAGQFGRPNGPARCRMRG